MQNREKFEKNKGGREFSSPEGKEKFIFTKKRSAVVFLRSRKCITKHNWITYQFWGGRGDWSDTICWWYLVSWIESERKMPRRSFLPPLLCRNQRLLCHESLIRLQKVTNILLLLTLELICRLELYQKLVFSIIFVYFFSINFARILLESRCIINQLHWNQSDVG